MMANLLKIPLALVTSLLFSSSFICHADEVNRQQQLKEWQHEFQNQLTRRFQQQLPKAASNPIKYRSRQRELVQQARHFAQVKGAFNEHQIDKYCDSEIHALCDPSWSRSKIHQCLAQHLEKLSRACNTAVSGGHRTTPILTKITNHGVSIPPGSSYYAETQPERIVGVFLSQPTMLSNIPIKGHITWYESGDIRSFIPDNNAVVFEQIIWAPNEEIIFFPSGKVKMGKVYQDVEFDRESFSAGDLLMRNDESAELVKISR